MAALTGFSSPLFYNSGFSYLGGPQNQAQMPPNYAYMAEPPYGQPAYGQPTYGQPTYGQPQPTPDLFSYNPLSPNDYYGFFRSGNQAAQIQPAQFNNGSQNLDMLLSNNSNDAMMSSLLTQSNGVNAALMNDEELLREGINISPENFDIRKITQKAVATMNRQLTTTGVSSSNPLTINLKDIRGGQDGIRAISNVLGGSPSIAKGVLLDTNPAPTAKELKAQEEKEQQALQQALQLRALDLQEQEIALRQQALAQQQAPQQNMQVMQLLLSLLALGQQGQPVAPQPTPPDVMPDFWSQITTGVNNAPPTQEMSAQFFNELAPAPTLANQWIL